MSINEKSRRDLELILLGLALSESGRAKVLSALSHGDWTREINPLIGSIRDKSPKDLAQWLDSRGVKPEKGQEFVEAIMDTVSRDNAHQNVQRICRGLSNASRVGDITTLKNHLTNALQELENLS